MIRAFIFCAGLISMLGLTGFGNDSLYIRNSDGAKVAILVNEQFGNGRWGNFRLLDSTSDSVIDMGEIAPGRGIFRQIILFSEEGPVGMLDNIRWSDTTDRDTITIPETVVLPIRFWVTCGADTDMYARALCAYLYAQERLFEEHTGIELGDFRIDFVQPRCRGNVCGNFHCPDQRLIGELGFDSTCVNVYYVESVDGQENFGSSCDYSGNFVALGARANPDILLHEIGHLMTLAHTDGNEGFDDRNIMWSASDERRYFSEGQIFRAHLASASVLNRLMPSSPSPGPRLQPPRTAPTLDRMAPWSDDHTPLLNLRIWEDM